MIKLLKHITEKGIDNIELMKSLNEFDSVGTYWLEIKGNNRKEITEYLSTLDIDNRALPYIKEPDLSTRINVFPDAMVINLHMYGIGSEKQTQYLSIFATKNIIITIINEHDDTFSDLEEELINNPFSLKLNLYLLLYFMISEIIQSGMEHVYKVRKEVISLSKEMEHKKESFLLNRIMKSKNNVAGSMAIVEDQYHMLGFIPKFDWNTEQESSGFRAELLILLRGYDYLLKILERQEDKLESLHSQYQSILHEKGNKRLNTLTIVQAIFVPLTLLSGIYGMNFTNMPELNWFSGYYLVLGIMGIIILIELWLFRKSGWFD